MPPGTRARPFAFTRYVWFYITLAMIGIGAYTLLDPAGSGRDELEAGFAIVFVVLGGVWMAAGIFYTFRGLAKDQIAEREGRLFESGYRAPARVTHVESTGAITGIRGSGPFYGPEVRIAITVRGVDGEFVHERKMFVPFEAIPRVGDELEVAYDPADPSLIALEPGWPGSLAGG